MITILDPAVHKMGWKCRVLSGPDARDFLHRLSTRETRSLRPGSPAAWGFILGAVGKVRAAFHLSCASDQEFWLEYDPGPQGEWDRALVETIDQTTFAEKQALSDPLEQNCLWVLGEWAGRQIPASLRLVDHGSRDFGRPWATVWGESAALQALKDSLGASVNAGDAKLLESWRLETVRPWFSRELTFDTMPLELGLLDGITQGKGCYPGQEVIERILTQGAPPRRLVRVRGVDGSARLALVRKSEAEVGRQVDLVLSEGTVNFQYKGQVEKCADLQS